MKQSHTFNAVPVKNSTAAGRVFRCRQAAIAGAVLFESGFLWLANSSSGRRFLAVWLIKSSLPPKREYGGLFFGRTREVGAHQFPQVSFSVRARGCIFFPELGARTPRGSDDGGLDLPALGQSPGRAGWPAAGGAAFGRNGGSSPWVGSSFSPMATRRLGLPRLG